MPLKLYIWDGVLGDYSPGVAFALAESEEHARALIIADAEDYTARTLVDDLAGPPSHVVDSPRGFHIHGGG